MYCRNCGRELETDANFCPVCGHPTGDPGCRRACSQAAVMMERKSEGIALILSLIITGAGHMYAGKIVDGVVLLALQVALSLGMFVVFLTMDDPFAVVIVGILCIATFVVWIYAIIDSNKEVKRYNQQLLSDSLSQM